MKALNLLPVVAHARLGSDEKNFYYICTVRSSGRLRRCRVCFRLYVLPLYIGTDSIQGSKPLSGRFWTSPFPSLHVETNEMLFNLKRNKLEVD